MEGFPANLIGLHGEEECVRALSLQHVQSDPELLLHLRAVERAMNLVDQLRQQPISDSDDEVMKLLALRMFNAFGSALRLLFSGYSQNAALVGRDLLETHFLRSKFQTDRSAIVRWTSAATAKQKDEFKPIRIRQFLDDRDGLKERKREKHYKLFCELAAHPTPGGFAMLRAGNGLAHGGPFYDARGLRAVTAELGKLGILVGEGICRDIPQKDECVVAASEFDEVRSEWLGRYYPNVIA